MKFTNFLYIFAFFITTEFLQLYEANISKITLDYESFKTKATKYISYKNLMDASNSKSLNYRKKEFKKNLNRMNKHNELYNKGKIKFILGVNQFSDWTDYEYKDYIKSGIRNSPYNSINKTKLYKKIYKKSRINSRISLPSSLNWTQKGIVTPVKNQGDCNYCTVYASIAALESQYAKITNELVNFSEQYLISCAENKVLCRSGGHSIEYLYFLKNKEGIPSETTYPLDSNNTNYQCIEKQIDFKFNVEEIYDVEPVNLIKALNDDGPLIVAIHGSDQKFRDYKGGIIDDFQRCNNKFKKTDHAVLLVGYDKDSFLFKNSFGDWWGENGYFRISRKKCDFYPLPIFPQIKLNENDLNL